jgi:hypothetical protein
VSQVRLYLDEDSMRRSLAFGLRARNVEVLTAAEANMINRQDEDHLAAASADAFLTRAGVPIVSEFPHQMLRAARGNDPSK